MELMEIGKVVNTFGIKGELKILPYVKYFEDLNRINIKNNTYEIERMRKQKNLFIVKLKGFDDINQIEDLKDYNVFIDEQDKPELQQGEYYIKDLIGFEVYTDEGKLLGKLDDVFNTGANDIYQVGEILLPAIKDVVKQVDTKNKKIIVHILKGLI